MQKRRFLTIIFLLVVLVSTFSLLGFRNYQATTNLEQYEVTKEYEIVDWWIYADGGEEDWWGLSGTPLVIFEAWNETHPYQDPSGVPWLWRITAYDAYTGFGWTKTNQNRYEIYPTGDPRRPGLRVRIPLGWVTGVQLDLPIPVGGDITAITQTSYRKLFMDPYDAYAYTIHTYYLEEVEYSVQWSTTPIIDGRFPSILNRNSSVWRRTDLAAGQLSEVPSWIMSMYTQLPSDLPSIVRKTAERLRVANASIYEQALTVAAFLYADFTYNSTRTKPLAGEDLVAFFLREKRGVCRHFSTAFAVLLRCLGVPVRVVIGPSAVFLDSQRHMLVGVTPLGAWNEVYIPGIGWVTIIPGRMGPCCCIGVPLTYGGWKALMEQYGREPFFERYGGWKPLQDRKEAFFDPNVAKAEIPTPTTISRVTPTPAHVTPAGGILGGLPAMFPLLAVALAAVLLITVPYAPRFMRSLRTLQRPKFTLKLPGRRGPLIAGILPPEILALAEQGRYREAVIACYHCFLYLLYKHRKILKEDGMTTREFKRSLTPYRELEQDDLTFLTSLYEEAFFSSHEITGEDFSHAYSSLDILGRQIRGD